MKRQNRNTPITWELRELSMMADRASIGLGLLMKHREARDEIGEKKQAKLLRAGISFCDSVLAGLNAEQEKETEYSRLSRKIAVLIEDPNIDLLKEDSLDRTEMIKNLMHIKTVLENILSGSTIHPDKELLNVQDLLHSTSLLFYKADIANLRQAEDIRSLRAYA